jgi:cell division protein FtsB
VAIEYRIVHRQRRESGWFIKPVVISCALFYLSFHVFHGERGLYSLWREQREYALLQQELANTQAQREVLERRVAGMRDSSLDRDLLDEQLRRMLGMAGHGEIVLLGK